MLMGMFKEYKGFVGTIEYNPEENLIYGKLAGIKDLVNYGTVYGVQNIIDLHHEFCNAVDDYIEFCKEIGKKPDKSND